MRTFLKFIPLADLENEYMFSFIYKKIYFTIGVCVMHTERTCSKCIKNDNDNYRFFGCVSDFFFKKPDPNGIILYIWSVVRRAFHEGFPYTLRSEMFAIDS